MALVYDFVFSCSHGEMICFVVVMVWCFVFKLIYKSQQGVKQLEGLTGWQPVTIQSLAAIQLM